MRDELFSTLKYTFAPANLTEQTFEKIEEVLCEIFSAKQNVVVGGYKFHTMHQSQLQNSAEFLRQLRKQAMKCSYGDALDEMLRDQLVVGIFREDIRRKLSSYHKLTLERAIEVINIEEQVDEGSYLFHKLHDSMSFSQTVKQIQNLKQIISLRTKEYVTNVEILIKARMLMKTVLPGKMKCNFCNKQDDIQEICWQKRK